MRRPAQILIVLVALAEGSAWTLVASGFRRLLLALPNAFGGSGDGAGTNWNSGGGLVIPLLFVTVWIFLISPYACMAAGSLNLIKGKKRRGLYAYSLVMLSLMTIGLVAALVPYILAAPAFPWSLVLMALGNIGIIGLWALALNVGERKSRERAKQSDESTMESTGR